MPIASFCFLHHCLNSSPSYATLQQGFGCYCAYPLVCEGYMQITRKGFYQSLWDKLFCHNAKIKKEYGYKTQLQNIPTLHWQLQSQLLDKWSAVPFTHHNNKETNSPQRAAMTKRKKIAASEVGYAPGLECCHTLCNTVPPRRPDNWKAVPTWPCLPWHTALFTALAKSAPSLCRSTSTFHRSKLSPSPDWLIFLQNLR